MWYSERGRTPGGGYGESSAKNRSEEGFHDGTREVASEFRGTGSNHHRGSGIRTLDRAGLSDRIPRNRLVPGRRRDTQTGESIRTGGIDPVLSNNFVSLLQGLCKFPAVIMS